MLTRSALLRLVVCSFVISLCPLLNAQTNGSLSGTVTDKTGSVVAGATVKVTSQSTGVARDAKTDDTGHYQVSVLPAAIFTIHVEASGFQPAEQKDIRLQVDEHRDVNFTLAPASVSTQVEVSATEIAVETTNPTLGQVINSQQVAQLPLNGRNFVQLATLTPGTTAETNPNSFFNGGPSSEVSTRGSFSLSVGGSRASSTDWLLDGADNNELTAGGIGILPSIDAIQEFKVLTFNYSAQYGTRAGPTVLVTTKSGSNKFHGTAFEFLRNTSLDARSYFAAEREKFNENQYGGSLGGPIRKDKTFFFIDYQGRNLRQGKPFTGQVPTSLMRTGNFTEISNGSFSDVPTSHIYNPWSTDATGARARFQCDGGGVPLAVNPDGTQATGTPCDIIPQELINPIAAQMVGLYPNANASGSTLFGNFVSVPVKTLDENNFDARIDHNFSSKDSLFARFSYDQADVYLPGGAPEFANQNPFGSNQNIANHGRNAAISETHIFSPNSINQISFSYNRIFNYIQSFGADSCESANLGIPGANISSPCPNAPPGASQSDKYCVSCGLVTTSVGGGFWGLGDRGFAPFQGGTNVYQITDSFDMIRGKHNIRMGFEFRANQMNVMTNAFQDGFWVFSNLWTVNGAGGDFTGSNMADFMLGLPDIALHDQTFEGATTGRRWKLYRPYVQDDWRVRPNLTLNLGLAWAMTTPITEAHDRQANFDFATGEFLVPGVNSDGRTGVKMDWTALEPRIGLAWTPFSDGKTSIRAGYAIFHDSSWNQGAQGLWENPPFFEESPFFGFAPFGCPGPFAPTGGGITPSACSVSGTPDGIPFGTGRSMSDGFPILTQPTDIATFGGNIQSQNLDFKQGMVQQYNLNIEHQMPGELVLTLGYAGSRSTHILVDGINLNVASPTACDPTSTTFDPSYHLGCGVPTVPYGFPIGNISNINDIGSARYDSLQVKLETQGMKHGLYALVGYTWSKAQDSGFADGIGTSTGATYYPLPGTAKADWALSQIDLNQNFTASVVYDLPFGKGKAIGSNWNKTLDAIAGGWQINVIEKILSGFPLFISNSNNGSGVNFASSTNRPDQVCNGRLNKTSVAEFFDTSCFVDAPLGQLGNASRTPLYGPGFVNTDFSAIKNFPLHEGINLQFRAEFFNIFNHAQFFTPGLDRASTDFGQISSTVGNPRLIQFALKLMF